MKALTKKLFISVLSVAFAVIALGTTTFAWFTLSNVATVQPFSAEVSAGDGIEISLDGNSWYSSITKDVMEGFLFNGYTDGETEKDGVFGTGFRFNHVTSVDGLAMTTLAGTLISETPTDGRLLNHPYLVFTLYIRSPKEMDVFWSEVDMPLTHSGVDLGQPWKADVDFHDAKGVAITTADPARTYYAAHAARISVEAGVNSYVYEKPVSNTVDLVVGNTVLGGLTDADIETDIAYTDLNYGAIEYFYNKNTAFPTGINSVTVTDTITSLPSTDVPANRLLTLTTSGDYFVGQVTVRIWLEGWDPDCYNAILSSRLAVSLKIMGKDPVV